ncbi:MAG: exodeoxyribonuclease VII small subunit [Firmicutes bacterium]|nr:exodeoxyribonuclease VII small subunit [Bacillota bacterium]HOB35009.1 exodeoxyribonuclease VII small subunit [Bacillota bacterium]HPZ90328.1 exodeoxyribonuclease VII small subunit [Bacillota bacterium]HQE01833.1 exodeoxyribonuclease VII small subunit [Bacillota bacterium]
MKFEQALNRLEEIVASLEQGETELEEALKLFEEGIGLIRACDKQLKEAEQKLEQLKSEGDEV